MLYNHRTRPPALLLTPSLNRLYPLRSSTPVMFSGPVGLTSAHSCTDHRLSLLHHYIYKPVIIDETAPGRIITTCRGSNKRRQPYVLPPNTTEPVTAAKEDEQEEKKRERELRRRFMKKVYGILAAQFIFANALLAVLKMHPPITAFLEQSDFFLFCLLFIADLSFKAICIIRKNNLVNYIFLGIFNLASIALGAALGNIHQAIPIGRTMLQAQLSTLAVFVTLTLFTFSKKRENFSYPEPFISSNVTVTVAVIAAYLQRFNPVPILAATDTVLGGSIFLSTYIIDDTEMLLLERFGHDEYIVASAYLFMDMYALFIAIVKIIRMVN